MISRESRDIKEVMRTVKMCAVYCVRFYRLPGVGAASPDKRTQIPSKKNLCQNKFHTFYDEMCFPCKASCTKEMSSNIKVFYPG